MLLLFIKAGCCRTTLWTFLRLLRWTFLQLLRWTFLQLLRWTFLQLLCWTFLQLLRWTFLQLLPWAVLELLGWTFLQLLRWAVLQLLRWTFLQDPSYRTLLQLSRALVLLCPQVLPCVLASSPGSWCPSASRSFHGSGRALRTFLHLLHRTLC